MTISRARADAREIVQLVNRHDYIVAIGIIEIMVRRIRAEGYADGATHRMDKVLREFRTEPLPPMKMIKTEG